jgi:hypothetical protein
MTSEEVWLERVVAWRHSGQSAAKFCEEASYDASSLRGWSSRLGRAGKVARAAVGRRAKQAPQSAVAFARVVTKAAPVPTSALPLLAAGRDALVVIIGPTRVEVAAGFDPELLRSVVAALATGAA